MFANLTFSRKIHAIFLTMTILFAFIISSTAAFAAKITTYYWDDGWIEHATWTTTTLGKDLTIDIDAWNWEPQFSQLSVKFDNVIALGEVDPITTSEGLVDDFDDGIINPLWHVSESEGDIVYESNGVLNIDIPAGTAPGGLCQVGGVITKDFVIHGDFDVQVDFSVNPEYHTTPNTNAKLFFTDQSGNSVEISIRSGHYLSVDLPSGLWTAIAMTPTDHLNGKLRMTRTETTKVDIDVKPGSDPNSINLDSNGLIPVAILSSQDFDATNVDPDTVMLAGAGVELRGKGSKYMAHEEDVNGDGLVDLVVQIGTANLDPGIFQDGYVILTGETFDNVSFEGEDEINIVPPEE